MSSGCPIPLAQGHVADDGPRPGEIRCVTFAVLLSRLIYSMQGGCGGCEGLRMPQAVRIEWSAREAWVPYRRRVSTSDIAFSFNLTYTEPRKSYIYIYLYQISLRLTCPQPHRLTGISTCVYIPLQEVLTPTQVVERPVSSRASRASELEASQPGSPVPVPPSPTV